MHFRKLCYKIPATQPGACVSEYLDPLIGAFIDGYEISELIGEGGIGRVYRAKHTFIGKQIAVKVLKPDYAKNKISMARLLQEARAVNEIRHENVVDIFNLLYRPDFGEAYILMELLEGRTLGDVMQKGGALLLPQIGHIGMQLCSALYAAHQKGIFHRDLKPDNIFLTTRAGQKNFVKIIDFGLAKLKEKSFQLTQDGALLGTPQYMAPEQMRGEQAEARTDIYALGLIFFEMATGETPHPAQHMAELYDKRLKEDAPDPRTKSAWLPKDLARLIVKCLARNPLLRYSSMREVAIELAMACDLTFDAYFSAIAPLKNAPEHDLFYETERFVPLDAALLLDDSPIQETQPVSFLEELISSKTPPDEDSHTQIDEAALRGETIRLSLDEPIPTNEDLPKKKP